MQRKSLLKYGPSGAVSFRSTIIGPKNGTQSPPSHRYRAYGRMTLFLLVSVPIRLRQEIVRGPQLVFGFPRHQSCSYFTQDFVQSPLSHLRARSSEPYFLQPSTKVQVKLPRRKTSDSGKTSSCFAAFSIARQDTPLLAFPLNNSAIALL
jgi:hypothetical protein